MFSNENKKQADMCRFCWMCRHICPVAGATGSEGWGPRARGLMVSMIERGSAELDAEIAEAMYHCTMCDACANDCETGWKPTDFIREARMYCVANEVAPAAINTAIDNILTKGNIYGEALNEKLAARIEALPETANVLVYIGQTGRCFGADSAISFLNILDKAKVGYTTLKDEPPTGALLGDMMGMTGDVQSVAVRAAEAIKASNAEKVVVLSPYDAVMLREQYAKWSLLDGIEIVSAPAFLAELISGGRLSLRKADLKASLQEPVKLTRGLDEIEPLKKVVSALGVDNIELFLNGKMSRCVGTAIMECYDPYVAKRMVEVRLDDARRIGSNAIITASPDDSFIMGKYAADDVTIIDLFGLIDSNC